MELVTSMTQPRNKQIIFSDVAQFYTLKSNLH